MAKLYPPNLAGTIPAFTGTTLVVPFAMNRSVSIGDLKYDDNTHNNNSIRIKIKTVQNDMFICTLDSVNMSRISGDNYYAVFDLNEYIFGEPVSLSQSEFEKGTYYTRLIDYDGNVTYEKATSYKNNSTKYYKRTTKDFQIGASYKIQMAYLDKNDNVGYYSTVGVIKYTTEPLVELANLEEIVANSAPNKILGHYSQKDLDTTEKEYSYRFQLYDKDKNLLEDTGFILHNSTEDVYSYESYDEYELGYTLEPNQLYLLKYIITTRNGMERSTPYYRIIDNDTVPPDISGLLIARNDPDNGCIELSFEDLVNDGNVVPGVSGNFELYRKSTSRWELIHKFTMTGQTPSAWHFKDMTIEHGTIYQYSIRQYSNLSGIYSSRMYLSKVYNPTREEYLPAAQIVAEFEDAFLFDGKRQLHIQYNPKVASFKIDVLEGKQDTIGGRTPYFFKNGNTYYREFPVSGLLSYLTDNDELFMTREELGISTTEYARYNYTISNGWYKEGIAYYELTQENQFKIVPMNEADYKPGKYYIKTTDRNIDYNLPTHNLVDYNIRAERLFKLEVLKWLNNGKPKLFRSPGEGNYLVRLLNNSLTPNDTVGRMLHTFNCTAYEVGDCNYDTLFGYGIYTASTNGEDIVNVLDQNSSVGYISEEEEKNNPSDIYLYKTYLLNNPYGSDKYSLVKYNTELISTEISPLSHIEISEAIPGTYIRVNGKRIMIGSTGTFHLDLEDGITSLIIEDPTENTDYGVSSLGGQITIGYKISSQGANGSVDNSTFERYESITTLTVPSRQIFGNNHDMLKCPTIDCSGSVPVCAEPDLIPYALENVTRNLISIPYARFYKRDVETLFYFGTSLGNESLAGFSDYANLYYDVKGLYQVKPEDLDEWIMYRIVVPAAITDSTTSSEILEIKNLVRGRDYYTSGLSYYAVSGAYMDIHNNRLYSADEYNCSIDFDNDGYDTDLSEIWMIEFRDIQRNEIDKLYIGVGVVAELTCYIAESYCSYSDAESYNNYKSNIIQLQEALNSANNLSEMETIENNLIDSIHNNYINYILNTTYNYQEYKWENGIID